MFWLRHGAVNFSFYFPYFPRCVYLPAQPAWLLSCSPRMGVVCGCDHAWPAHLCSVEEWKSNVISPGSGQLRRPGSNLYEHLSPVNPAVNQLGNSALRNHQYSILQDTEGKTGHSNCRWDRLSEASFGDHCGFVYGILKQETKEHLHCYLLRWQESRKKKLHV